MSVRVTQKVHFQIIFFFQFIYYEAKPYLVMPLNKTIHEKNVYKNPASILKVFSFFSLIISLSNSKNGFY